jgi:arginyl-tRNA synthetase
MKENLLEKLTKIALEMGIDVKSLKLDYPDSFEHGDYSTNIALLGAKNLKISPKELAEKIVTKFKNETTDFVESVTIAGPGFINFKLKNEFFVEKIIEISKGGEGYGRSNIDIGKTILIEHTDPNTFKAFHIGHLMTNAIGESLSRLIEYCGAKPVRICYPSDIGLHIAKSVWAIQKHSNEMPADDAPIIERTSFLGKMYVEGTNAYDADTAAKNDIDALNLVIYEKKSPEINALYEKGRKWSLDHFELLYKVLDTKFDEYIFESKVAPIGLEIVRANLGKVFEGSEGAIVFKGEKYGLHTRVFVNSTGLPTYEAKDLGLNAIKFSEYPDASQSIIVTASEQNDYFKVVLKAFSMIDNNIASKTLHIGHGMMRFASGKMSSRKGNVITAETLLADIKEMIAEKTVGREFSKGEMEEISNTIAVAAVKYSILRSSIGSDIIFDSSKSISFEGDSGPYLQYSAVRANSILEKAKLEGIDAVFTKGANMDSVDTADEILAKLIVRFPEIIERARNEYAPQHVANYLINLAGAFNSFYASQTIVDKNNKMSSYYVALSKAFLTTITNGLWILGIKVPERM